MAKTKKPAKKQPKSVSLWDSSWTEMDRAFDNFRRDLEKSFASFQNSLCQAFQKYQKPPVI